MEFLGKMFTVTPGWSGSTWNTSKMLSMYFHESPSRIPDFISPSVMNFSAPLIFPLSRFLFASVQVKSRCTGYQVFGTFGVLLILTLSSTSCST